MSRERYKVQEKKKKGDKLPRKRDGCSLNVKQLNISMPLSRMKRPGHVTLPSKSVSSL